MNKTIIYSCVFFNEKYINLINLLLKSYKLFGNSPDDVDYLIICNPKFQKKIQAIFDNLNINGKIWCIDLKTIFEAGYSRLKIFDYPNINLYNKILYLDCDILVTNSINNILDFQLKNKLYVLKEDCHRQYHCELHTAKEYKLFDKSSAFTSGILLFNNNIIIKDLFSQILLHIDNHIINKRKVPRGLDQPFIVYHAVKNNLYDNKKLISIAVNNPGWKGDALPPSDNRKGETISHFSGGPGKYESKIVKMSNYMRYILFNIKFPILPKIHPLLNKTYKWENHTITFLKNGQMNAFGPGKYRFIDKYLVKCDFGGREHILKFNQNYSTFISVRKNDFEVVKGINILLNVVQGGHDGFGHQIEGLIRLISLHMNNRIFYNYDFMKNYSFEHSNFSREILVKYIENVLQLLRNIHQPFTKLSEAQEQVVLPVVFDLQHLGRRLRQRERKLLAKGFFRRGAQQAKLSIEQNITLLDGVGFGKLPLPEYFAGNRELSGNLKKLRKIFVTENVDLPKPIYDINNHNICIHIRLGDAVTVGRKLDKNIIKTIDILKLKYPNSFIHVFSDEPEKINYKKDERIILYDKNADVLMIFSCFIHSDILVVSYSSLSIAAHLLGKKSQIVYIPDIAGPTFPHRVLRKCIKISSLF